MRRFESSISIIESTKKYMCKLFSRKIGSVYEGFGSSTQVGADRFWGGPRFTPRVWSARWLRGRSGGGRSGRRWCGRWRT